MKVCITGAAEDIKFTDIDEVRHQIDRILLPTDGSAPSVAATEFAVILAKTFGATIKAVYVDTGIEALEYPEEIADADVFEGVHPSIKGLALAKTMLMSSMVSTWSPCRRLVSMFSAAGVVIVLVTSLVRWGRPSAGDA
jgi:hypothetical protein